jgi:hypothetical protein
VLATHTKCAYGEGCPYAERSEASESKKKILTLRVCFAQDNETLNKLTGLLPVTQKRCPYAARCAPIGERSEESEIDLEILRFAQDDETSNKE